MDSKIQKTLDDFFTQFKHQKYKKGYVKEYAISKKGDELVINIFKPISFFPMSWAINNTPNMYFFEAITDLEVWRVPKDKALEFIKTNPDVLYDLLSRVYKGTDGLLTRMTYLMSGNAYARLITELVIYAKRFGNPLHISEKDLAASSGMTRETVSREVRILKSKGLVSFQKGKLLIIDTNKLEGELF